MKVLGVLTPERKVFMGKRGPMPGTGGRPKKALSEKLSNDNYGYKTFKVIPAPSTYDGADVPEPNAYIKAKQKNGFFSSRTKPITIPQKSSPSAAPQPA